MSRKAVAPLRRCSLRGWYALCVLSSRIINNTIAAAYINISESSRARLRRNPSGRQNVDDFSRGVTKKPRHREWRGRNGVVMTCPLACWAGKPTKLKSIIICRVGIIGVAFEGGERGVYDGETSRAGRPSINIGGASPRLAQACAENGETQNGILS